MSKWVKRVLSILLVTVLFGGALPAGGLLVQAEQAPIQAQSNGKTGDDGTTNWDFIEPVTHLKTAPAGYTEIRTAQQLSEISNKLYGKFILMNDIDLYPWGNWVPIGNASLPFGGVFDGNGYVIKNLRIEGNGYDHNGLFGYVVWGGIKNLGLEDTYISVTRTSSAEFVSAGGISGYHFGWQESDTSFSINNCYSNNGYVSIKATPADPQGTGIGRINAYGGGISGHFSAPMGASIENCYNTGGEVFVSTDSVTTTSVRVGGIYGGSQSNYESVRNCYNTGKVTATSSAIIGIYSDYSNIQVEVGGISGVGGARNCFNTGEVNASAASFNLSAVNAGGITGSGEASSCYNTGAIYASNSNSSAGLHTSKVLNVGGITGLGWASSNCYNRGTISATVSSMTIRTNVGGISGATTGDNISNCYNIGNLSVAGTLSAAVGGICGNYISSFNSKITNCYALYLYNSEHGTQLASEDLKKKESFVGWNFNTVWDISSSVNSGYPFLRNMPGGEPEEPVGDSGPMLLNFASPISESINVSRGVEIALTFTLPIESATVRLNKADNSKVDTDIEVYSSTPNVLRITPKTLLDPNTKYYLIIEDGHVVGRGTNESGNTEFKYFAGFASEQDYYFTTGTSGSVSLTYRGYTDAGGNENFTANWNDNLFAADPNDRENYPGSKEWKDLAIISGILSGLAYGGSKQPLLDAYRKIGCLDVKDDDFYNDSSAVGLPGYAFGHKKIILDEEPKDLVIAVFRGTESTSFWDDWGTNATQYLGGIEIAANAAFTILSYYLEAHSIEMDEAIFLVTGHSLGGSMANYVANTLSNKVVNKSNVFAFTFSGPKTAMKNLSPHNNISNFISTTDTVAYLPTIVYLTLGTLPPIVCRYGRNYYVSTPVSPSGLDSHRIGSYIRAVQNMTGTGGSAKWYNFLLVQCPVDIEIYDNKNILAGKISNNIVSSNTIVPALVDGDNKWFLLPTDEKFTMRLTGTDTGEMDFTVYGYNYETEEISKTKAYTNVALQNGKRFFSEVGDSIDVPNVQLLVTNNAGTPIARVNLDGTETPITPTHCTLTYDANGGTGAPAAVTVPYNTSFNLSSTKPIRTGHTFLGWTFFPSATIALLDPGTRVTLTADMTLYAVWETAPNTPTKTIFSTKYPATFINWILFFVCFGWIWMWF